MRLPVILTLLPLCTPACLPGGSFCSYLEHAGLAIPPATPPAPASAAPAGGGAVASDSGIVVVNGVTVNVLLLQQRLVSGPPVLC